MSTTTTLDPEQTGRWAVTTDDGVYLVDLNRHRPTLTVNRHSSTTTYDLRFLISCHIGEPMSFVVHDLDPTSLYCYMQNSHIVRSIRSA